MLNVLEEYKLRANDPASLHLMIEAMKLAYADRAQHLGDPDTVKVPVAGLSSKSYAKLLRDGIDPDKAKPAWDIKPGNPALFGGDNTTHYSVVDRFGNAVSNTYTLNLSYGNGLVAAGTGVLLNNELDDFAAKPNAPNSFGLVGLNAANAPGPNKRPLSSMTPTIVLKDGKPVLITGSPGGSRIITTVLQVILNVFDYKMPVEAAVAAPRLHHQWLPDEVWIEPGLPPAVLKNLEARGHKCAAHLGHLGELDPGDAQEADRRRRHPHARGAGGGILTPSASTSCGWRTEAPAARKLERANGFEPSHRQRCRQRRSYAKGLPGGLLVALAAICPGSRWPLRADRAPATVPASTACRKSAIC